MDLEKLITGVLAFVGGVLTALLSRFIPSHKELMDDNARLREENEALRDIRQDQRESLDREEGR